MPFSTDERAALLAVKGVGPTVVKRLEEQGFTTLRDLAGANMDAIVAHAAASLGSTCWKNSPQARAAINAAIACAKAWCDGSGVVVQASVKIRKTSTR